MNPDDVDPQWVTPHRLHHDPPLEFGEDPEIEHDRRTWGIGLVRGLWWGTLAVILFYFAVLVVLDLIFHW